MRFVSDVVDVFFSSVLQVYLHRAIGVVYVIQNTKKNDRLILLKS